MATRGERAFVMGAVCVGLAACAGAPDDAGSTGGDAGMADAGPEELSCPVPPSQTGPLVFEKCVLDDQYRNEGVGAFDVNGDETPDVVTDQFWYEGPRFVPHEIRVPQTWNPFGSYAIGFGAYPMDVNRDGCTDVVAPPHVGDPFRWYQHPCRGGRSGAEGHWASHVIAEARHVGLENPFLIDLFADGRPVAITNDYPGEVFGLTEPPSDPTRPWPIRPLAPAGTFEAGGAYTHGVGAGDLDGDSDLDVLTSWGWFESPGSRDGEWIAHLSPNPFAGSENECSRMWVYDVSGDGLGDVICSEPHGRGVHWLEQVAPVAPATEATFVKHRVEGSEMVTQMHALVLADLDGDGTSEIISGSRWCAHCGFADTDDPNTPYVVYYKIIRESGTVTFQQSVIDDESGVGVAFDVADFDGDGRLDIVIANKRGLFVFRQRSE